MGDFNIHVCCPSKPLVRIFFNVLESFDLLQCVFGPTHEHGHTLDLVLSFGFSVDNLKIVDTVFFVIRLFFLAQIFHAML